MAYSNEFMTEEEKKWFEAKKIPDPVSFGALTLDVYVWTIDRERGTYLIDIGHIPEETDEYFYFFWGNTSFIVLMRHEYNDCEWIWHLLNIKSLENVKFDTIEMKVDLRKAMVAFGASGNPRLEKTNNKKIVIDF